MAHEIGHLLAARYVHWSDNWKHAKKADKNKVSNYGEIDLEEDFAEAVRVYIETDGGTKNIHLLKKFKNRFKILDDLMELDLDARKEILQELKIRMANKRIFWSTVAVGTTLQLSTISMNDENLLLENDEI